MIYMINKTIELLSDPQIVIDAIDCATLFGELSDWNEDHLSFWIDDIIRFRIDMEMGYGA